MKVVLHVSLFVHMMVLTAVVQDAVFTHWRIWSSAATSVLFAVSPIPELPRQDLLSISH